MMKYGPCVSHIAHPSSDSWRPRITSRMPGDGWWGASGAKYRQCSAHMGTSPAYCSKYGGKFANILNQELFQLLPSRFVKANLENIWTIYNLVKDVLVFFQTTDEAIKSLLRDLHNLCSEVPKRETLYWLSDLKQFWGWGASAKALGFTGVIFTYSSHEAGPGASDISASTLA